MDSPVIDRIGVRRGPSARVTKLCTRRLRTLVSRFLLEQQPRQSILVDDPRSGLPLQTPHSGRETFIRYRQWQYENMMKYSIVVIIFLFITSHLYSFHSNDSVINKVIQCESDVDFEKIINEIEGYYKSEVGNYQIRKKEFTKIGKQISYFEIEGKIGDIDLFIVVFQKRKPFNFFMRKSAPIKIIEVYFHYFPPLDPDEYNHFYQENEVLFNKYTEKTKEFLINTLSVNIIYG
jgi:hypothetical protein